MTGLMSINKVLDGKSFEERIAWMLDNPPQLESRAEDGRDLDERCTACGGLVHDDSESDGARCRCAGALRRCRHQVDAADPGVGMTFRALELGGDPSVRNAAAAARRVAAGEQRGLAMFGPPGTGKTHIAISACRLALSKRTTAGFHNVVELVSRVQETYGRGRREEDTRSSVIAEVAGRELVVLDDLGKERDTGDVRTIVYELVDAIHRSGRRLIVCSNLGGDQYRARYDEAVTSRIAGICEAVPVLGADRRRAR